MDREFKESEVCGSCEMPEVSRAGMKKSGEKSAVHPDHAASKKRINRVKGQLDGVSRMIEQREYCPEIIQQIRAATSALKSLEAEVLKRHLTGCVRNAFRSNDAFEAQEKIDEILRLLK